MKNILIRRFKSRWTRRAVVIAALFFQIAAMAEIIDAEAFILKNGYHETNMGDDGKSPFYRSTERTSLARVTTLENDATPLVKNDMIFKACDFIRGGAKAKAVQSSGAAVDVVLSNYGAHGKTVMCALKYILGNQIGTQLTYMTKGKAGLYMVIVTH